MHTCVCVCVCVCVYVCVCVMLRITKEYIKEDAFVFVNSQVFVASIVYHPRLNVRQFDHDRNMMEAFCGIFFPYLDSNHFSLYKHICSSTPFILS